MQSGSRVNGSLLCHLHRVLQQDFLELDYCAVVVELERDGPALEPALTDAIDELGGQHPVDEELEMVTARSHVTLIPITHFDVINLDGFLDPLVTAGPGLVDQEASSTFARKLRSCREMEVPRAQDSRTDSHVA